VRVAVGGDAEIRALLEHGLAQRVQAALRRGRHAAAEQRVVPGVDHLDLAAGADQDGLQTRLGTPNIGSSTTFRCACRMDSRSSWSMIASRYQLIDSCCVTS